MEPAEAIRESRVSIAFDATYEPLVYYCSTRPLVGVRKVLLELRHIQFGEEVHELGASAVDRRMLVPLDKAKNTDYWEPLCPSTAVDKLGDLARLVC